MLLLDNEHVGKFLQNLINTKDITSWVFLAVDKDGTKFALSNEENSKVLDMIVKGEFLSNE